MDKDEVEDEEGEEGEKENHGDGCFVAPLFVFGVTLVLVFVLRLREGPASSNSFTSSSFAIASPTYFVKTLL